MSRPLDPLTPYRVGIHVTKGYKYASTQPHSVDSSTGKKSYAHIHWGCVTDENKFIPNNRFNTATSEEREKLIFPDDWDLSELDKINKATNIKSQTLNFAEQYCNLLYGDIWLLEQIAEKTGIRQDLEIVFEGDVDIVNDIITLAIFPYLTRFSYNRVARWQRNVKSPSARELTPSAITKLTQSINEQNRMDLFKLRASRITEDELCAADSTTRRAYGSSLTDIRWGRSKEDTSQKQTIETVVYSLTSHMPVYYRTFPGNMPDSRSMDVMLADLEDAGFNNIIMSTDRGYETMQNLENCILRGQRVVMCTKTSQKDVTKAIVKLGNFGVRPDGMTIDPKTKLYYIQYEISRKIEDFSKSTPKNLRLNLYFDSVRRSIELREMDICISLQHSALTDMQKNGDIISADIDTAWEFCYYNISFCEKSRKIKSFVINEAKVEKSRKLSGFFSIMTHGVDKDAMQTYHIYKLRDEQERYFQQMKDQLCADRQRNWSEEGKTGRLFILFVSLILSSYIRHIWKTTELSEIFSSSLEVLDEMRAIRYVAQGNDEPLITPFVGNQLEICKQFGLEIPKNCKPTSRVKIRRKNKKGIPTVK